MNWNLLVLISLFSTLHSYASSELLKPWQGYSNPAIMNSAFKKTFIDLPLVGQAVGKKKYWSSFYWPLYKGNINFRWNAPNPTGFNLKSPSYVEALLMTPSELAALAPSEKYDLFVGNYNYPLRKEVQKRVSPNRLEWEGICHGWAAAALNHNEPVPVIATNPDGIAVPFGSSDLKGLLSYYYANHYDPVSTHQMGRRCNGRRHCGDDLNAGAFHIVLSNKVGLEGGSFIADIENGREVWNQVIYNYRTKILNDNLPPIRSSANGTVRMVRVKTTMRVVFNIGRNSWLPVIGTPLQTYLDKDYEYDLDLNTEGAIIGGNWISKNRPDFLWRVDVATKFDGLFSRLNELLPKGNRVKPPKLLQL